MPYVLQGSRETIRGESKMKSVEVTCEMVAVGTHDSGHVYVWKTEFGFIFSTNPDLTGPGTIQGIVKNLEDVREEKIVMGYESGSIGCPGHWIEKKSRTFSWGELNEAPEEWKKAQITIWDQEMKRGFISASGAAGFFRRNTSQSDAALGEKLPEKTDEFVGEPHLAYVSKA